MPRACTHSHRLDDVLEETAGTDAEDDIEARCQLVPEPAQFIGGKFFAEEDDAGSNDAAAFLAPRGKRQVRIVWCRGLTAASRTLKLMKVAVQVEHVPGARPLMQSVNILGEHPDGVEILIHLGDHPVAAVRRGVAAGLLQFEKIMPGNLGLDAEHGAGQCLLDGQAVRGFLLGSVNTVASAVRGKARLGRDARARDEQQRRARPIACTVRSMARALS